MGFPRRLRFASVCLLPLALARLHATEMHGLVTRAGTPEHFFVNEREVHCVPGKTKVRQLRSDGLEPEQRVACPQLIGTSAVAHLRDVQLLQQSTRNALVLMPDRTRYAYFVLNTVWRGTPLPANP